MAKDKAKSVPAALQEQPKPAYKPRTKNARNFEKRMKGVRI